MASRPQELLRLLTRAERLAVRRVQSVLDEFDCSVEAWRVLDLLSDGQGHHMTAVADHAFLPAPSATKLVDQLVDQNLVFRRVDPADRRRVLAYLTPRGIRRWEHLVREVQADWAELEPLLVDDERGERLEGLLDRLAGVLEDGRDVTTTRAERAVGRGR
ncbi:MarR family winged helix-turn-helix transcriptional regulator [Streptomyces sp. ME18-1-4]|uniref:MarR family winged helix-turn-helix transcriptional regulator n=1 Tax=Streptomyces sp. ME18-1-4 TaxID=3028685 RepID=UPI0029B09AFD|nr:MarR family transcriptional regulator [Streptomyces sp. ME18-1-4]MDX3241331.1 MarR family transcriptional regulator [Streptomyces sp. ME18-1-4]